MPFTGKEKTFVVFFNGISTFLGLLMPKSSL